MPPAASTCVGATPDPEDPSPKSHLKSTGTARTPTGIRIPDHTRDKISCDATIQPVWETNGLPFSIGRTHHSVPERTRRIIMLRDQGCRVPGCTHDRIIEIHHIIHWANGGPTDTWNLVALCAHHHRQHHHGQLDITGNADQPNGLTFTNHRGQPLHPTGPPTPPTKPPQPDTPYQPPRMEPVNWDWVGTSWPDP